MVDRGKILNALITSKNLSEAARVAGVSRGSVYGCLADRDFVAALQDMQRTLTVEAFEGLRQRREEALQCLADIMSNEDCAADDRIKACSIILGQAEKAQNTAEKALIVAFEKSNPLNGLLD